MYEAKTSVGLVRGHAYSVTKVVKAKIETPRISGEMPLIRVRHFNIFGLIFLAVKKIFSHFPGAEPLG